MPSTLQHVASCLFVFLISSTTALPTHDNVEQASASDVGNQRCTSHDVCRPNEFCSKVEPSGIYPWTKSSQNLSYGYCTLCSQGCLEDQMFPAQNIFTETCREVCPIEHECDTHADCPEEGQWCSRDHKCHRCSSECGSYNRIYDVTSAGTSIDGSCPETCCDWGLRYDLKGNGSAKDLLSEDNLHVYIGACDASLSFHAGILVLQGEKASNTVDDLIKPRVFEPEDFGFEGKDSENSTQCLVMEHHFDEGYPRKVVEVNCKAAIGISCHNIATVAATLPDATSTGNYNREGCSNGKSAQATFLALLVSADTGLLNSENKRFTFAQEPFDFEAKLDDCSIIFRDSQITEGSFPLGFMRNYPGMILWLYFCFMAFIFSFGKCIYHNCKKQEGQSADEGFMPKAIFVEGTEKEDVGSCTSESETSEFSESLCDEKKTSMVERKEPDIASIGEHQILTYRVYYNFLEASRTKTTDTPHSDVATKSEGEQEDGGFV